MHDGTNSAMIAMSRSGDHGCFLAFELGASAEAFLVCSRQRYQLSACFN
ncbi:Hypothetical protein LOCK908_0995 [Lacticaseibacillus rhamnosus LOCK908]|uniref:Uncharacterized protein n=1 Tax=Lacticaseibacillus rhamnosus (strain LMS2-1) TaxID=525361 RepID=C2JVU2_LACRM|nr:conserved hypothetical protein [Lacticaseibacillus rhamnosus ATCC 8530]AGP73639.1 Hypothetical protein LOCK908_0995 [Lacticaseibacillus rhamnosus LOCK908]EEN80874.1 hypothetical protein HMPREF0539_1026 [Lacticaseibacillus rhamnosus LMS2-1]